MPTDFVHEGTARGESVFVPRRFGTYEVLSTVGSGSHAVVMAVRDLVSNRRFAAKVINKPKSCEDALTLLTRELRVCLTIKCPYLVECHEIVDVDDVIIIVMELCEGVDLLTLIMQNLADVHSHWKMIFTQICLAVQYLHKRGLAHRDIKPDNIMIDKHFNVKVCDYGYVCESGESTVSTSARGTVQYVSPEILLRNGYCAIQSDIWSLGITLYVAVTARFPWKTPTDGFSVCSEILEENLNMGVLPEEVRSVVERCCDPNPTTRATIEEILQCSFVQLPKTSKTSDLPKLLRSGVSQPKSTFVNRPFVVKPSSAKPKKIRFPRKRIRFTYGG